MNRKLIAAREQKCWTQEDVAEKIGVSPVTISRWENSVQHPRSFMIHQLCTIFETSAEALELKSNPASGNFLRTERLATLFNGTQLEERDWAIWFGLKQAHILTVIEDHSASFCGEHIQMLVDQEIKMLDDELQLHNMSELHSVSRRQALVALAALATGFTWKSGSLSDTDLDRFLPKCATSITACWHLMKETGFTAVSDILSRFVPALRTIALRPSKYQQIAAGLATQASIQQAILSMHQLNFNARESSCHDAVRYAHMSTDKRLQAASLMYLAYTYSHCYYPRLPHKAIPLFHQALHALQDETSLLRSDILLGLAEAYAQCKEEQEALRCIGAAQECFPAYPEHDPSFIYADCGINTLSQWQGKTYLQLAQHFPSGDYHRQAADSLMQSIGIQSISERSKGETAIYRADAARAIGELDMYLEALRDAVDLALSLQSKRRYHDTYLVFEKTPARWLKEAKIHDLSQHVFQQRLLQ